MTSKEFHVAVFAGDGIGPEIMKETLKVLRILSDKSSISISFTEGLIGGAAYDACQTPSQKRA